MQEGLTEFDGDTRVERAGLSFLSRPSRVFVGPTSTNEVVTFARVSPRPLFLSFFPFLPPFFISRDRVVLCQLMFPSRGWVERRLFSALRCSGLSSSKQELRIAEIVFLHTKKQRAKRGGGKECGRNMRRRRRAGKIEMKKGENKNTSKDTTPPGSPHPREEKESPDV